MVSTLKCSIFGHADKTCLKKSVVPVAKVWVPKSTEMSNEEALPKQDLASEVAILGKRE